MSALLPKADITERGLHTQCIFIPRRSSVVSAPPFPVMTTKNHPATKTHLHWHVKGNSLSRKRMIPIRRNYSLKTLKTCPTIKRDRNV